MLREKLGRFEDLISAIKDSDKAIHLAENSSAPDLNLQRALSPPHHYPIPPRWYMPLLVHHS